MVNQFYFYCVDDDFGPFFLKFCSYFPYNAKLCINGNEWAKRQAAKAGIGFTALDNGFAAVDDPAAVQAICDGLGPDADRRAAAQVAGDACRTRSPPRDRAAGYRYDLSILQAEFSLTQMLDRPVSGRVFFEQVIRDNLDIGRPDQVSLIFDRRVSARGPRANPGPVPHPGDHRRRHPEPARRLQAHHASSSTTRKDRALRTETTINDTRDFGIGKRLTNLPALREIGFSANRRLLRVQRLSHDPITGADALHAVTDPITTDTGTRIPGLRLGEQRSHALLIGAAGVPAATRTGSPTKTCAPHRRAARPRPRHGHRRADDLRPAPADARTASSPGSRTPTATRSPTHGLHTAMFLTASTTASCPPASPNSPPHNPPRALCDPLPPHTAPRSKTSPPQHNSRNETPPPQPHSNTNKPDPHTTNLTQKYGSAGSRQSS